MKKKNTKETKVKTSRNKVSWDNVKGLLQVFVLVSICYSTYLVALGTDGLVPKVMLAPQVLFGAFLLINKFIK